MVQFETPRRRFRGGYAALAAAGAALALVLLLPAAALVRSGGGISLGLSVSTAGSHLKGAGLNGGPSVNSGGGSVFARKLTLEEVAQQLLELERNRTQQTGALLRAREAQLAEAQRLLQERSKQLEEKNRQLQEQEGSNKELAEERKLRAEENETCAEEEKELTQRATDAEAARDNIDKEKNILLGEAKAGLYSASLVFRQLLRANASQLRQAWEARLKGARQRGIVVPAGGDDSPTLVNAFVTLHVLRHHLNCSLPVALTYWGANESPDVISDRYKKIFQDNIPAVEFIDASKLPYPEHHRPLMPSFVGWKVKVFGGLYAAPFREVFLLDSDSMPLLEPGLAFETEEYKRAGNLFWPDLYVGDKFGFRVEELYTMFRLPNPWADKETAADHQTEAGQLVFNRERLWEVLEWVLFLNSHNEVIYRTSYGDKDTYRLAFHLAGRAAEFQQVPHGGAPLYDGLKWKSIVHLLPNGSLFLHHRTPLGKFDFGDPKLSGAAHSSHVGAATSGSWGEYVFQTWSLKEEEVRWVDAESCSGGYSLYDWHAAQRRCAPEYNISARGREGGNARLPLFMVPPGSYFAAAEAAADAAFARLKAATGRS